MKDKQKKNRAQAPSTTNDQSSIPPLNRRQLARVGVGAPVLMSLFSRPVWGLACSPSGMMSGNVSGHDHDDCDGRGCTPGFWKNNLEAWSDTGYSPGMCDDDIGGGGKCKEWSTEGGSIFRVVFGFDPAISPPSDPYMPSVLTLLDVMLEHELAGSIGTYENHLVAALLNAAKAPFIYGATAKQIIDLGYAVETGELYEGVMISLDDLFALLVNMNEAGECFLNAHGDCAPGYVEYDGACIPCCKVGESFDFETGQCVQTSSDPE